MSRFNPTIKIGRNTKPVGIWIGTRTAPVRPDTASGEIAFQRCKVEQKTETIGPAFRTAGVNPTQPKNSFDARGRIKLDLIGRAWPEGKRPDCRIVADNLAIGGNQEGIVTHGPRDYLPIRSFRFDSFIAPLSFDFLGVRQLCRIIWAASSLCCCAVRGTAFLLTEEVQAVMQMEAMTSRPPDASLEKRIKFILAFLPPTSGHWKLCRSARRPLVAAKTALQEQYLLLSRNGYRSHIYLIILRKYESGRVVAHGYGVGACDSGDR